MRRIVPFAAAVVAVLAVGSASASAREFRVANAPSKKCPSADFTSIQAAVDASGPGDTVKVCPGTYMEQVRIQGHQHDRLKLESLEPLQAIVKWPTVESFPLALVDINQADKVTVRGFTLTGPFTFPACSPDRHEGVLIDTAFDAQIRQNHITEIRNSLTTLRGCQEGDAVSIGRRTVGVPPSDPSVPVSSGTAVVELNQIDKYQKNGVQVTTDGSFGDLEHNVVIGTPASPPDAAPNGLVIRNSGAGVIEHNWVSDNQYATLISGGIIATTAKPGVKIDHNDVFRNDMGIEVDSTTNGEIKSNFVHANRADGIQLCGDMMQGCDPISAMSVADNHVFGNLGSGIDLLSAKDNTLKANHVEHNGTAGGDTTDGLRVDSNSTGNQILENHMDSNVTHDCHDDSAGPGTAGTANFWRNDQGDTENRPGLCKHG